MDDTTIKLFLGILDGVCRQFFSDVKIAVQKKDGYTIIAIRIPENFGWALIGSGQKKIIKRRE